MKGIQIWCDGEHCAYFYRHEDDNVRAARRGAIAEGWERRGKRLLCPLCVVRAKAANP